MSLCTKLITNGNYINPNTFYTKICTDWGTVYTDAVSFVTASVSMRLHLSFTRHLFEFVIRTGSFRKRFQKWSVFKTIRFHWSCKRWNGLARNWLARKVSCSMLFPGHETVSIGNRVRVYAAWNCVVKMYNTFSLVDQYKVPMTFIKWLFKIVQVSLNSTLVHPGTDPGPGCSKPWLGRPRQAQIYRFNHSNELQKLRTHYGFSTASIE